MVWSGPPGMSFLIPSVDAHSSKTIAVRITKTEMNFPSGLKISIDKSFKTPVGVDYIKNGNIIHSEPIIEKPDKVYYNGSAEGNATEKPTVKNESPKPSLKKSSNKAQKSLIGQNKKDGTTTAIIGPKDDQEKREIKGIFIEVRPGSKPFQNLNFDNPRIEIKPSPNTKATGIDASGVEGLNIKGGEIKVEGVGVDATGFKLNNNKDVNIDANVSVKSSEPTNGKSDADQK